MVVWAYLRRSTIVSLAEGWCHVQHKQSAAFCVCAGIVTLDRHICSICWLRQDLRVAIVTIPRNVEGYLVSPVTIHIFDRIAITGAPDRIAN